MDEDGNDGMAFNSENHTLLFHSCQYIAGTLFPGETFTASNRISSRTERSGPHSDVLKWLNERHAHGFTEYLSSTYTPITAAALLNLVDFSDDKEIRTSATTLLDRLLRQLAEHAFDGVTTGPQGRVYRSVLYPHTSAAQGLVILRDWGGIRWSNRSIRGPCIHGNIKVDIQYLRTWHLLTDIDRSAEHTIKPINCILLHKTANYVLSSVQIEEDTPLKAGEPGYQDSICCTHPCQKTATSLSIIQARRPTQESVGPGYWNGNGVLPCTDAAGIRRYS